MSIKKIMPVVLALALWFSTTAKPVLGASADLYVSPTGNDANTCSSTAPCKTIQKAVNMLQAGNVLHILAGTYSESIVVSKVGTQAAPIRIVGEGAVLANGGAGAFSISNSQWVSLEGFTITGYTGSDIEISNSHYLTFKNNKLQYLFAGIRIQSGVSHLLIESNELYQTLPAGSTWSTIKYSIYEGAGVYASSGGQGMYYIRNNNFHDSMNGVYISDKDAGNWMNANIFISRNKFTNIMDDAFEPEGDSFNLHFFNNKLTNVHRVYSAVPNAACVGPVFVYGNYQLETADPTGEAVTKDRKNSMVKFDMRGGTCPKGIYVFNNTVNGNAPGINFYGVDLLDASVKNFFLMNNVFVTQLNAYSQTPSFSNASIDYDISLKPFGYAENHGIQADPLLAADGTLTTSSPAKGKSTAVTINTYFASSTIVPAGADLGGFRSSFPQPVYVTPPGGEPSNFPGNAAGWPPAP
ncbi:MAG: right-handed parallel beta-helix repeat-containing protein [Anaerolineales bacterium]